MFKYQRKKMPQQAHLRQLFFALLLAVAGYFILADTQTAYAQDGTINVMKRSQSTQNADLTQDFDFTGDLGAFQLQRNESNSATVASGSDYTISETQLPGWFVANIKCEVIDEGNTPGKDSTDTGFTGVETSITVSLKDDETVECIFFNVKEVTFTIAKVDEDGGTDPFDFTSTLAAPNDTFTVNAGSSTSFTRNPAFGTVDFTESVPPGWTLTDISCAGALVDTIYSPSGGTTFAAGDTTVTISPTAGEDITCTFTNDEDVIAADGRITIIKDAVPDDAQDFTFELGSVLLATPTLFTLDDDADATLLNTETFNGLAPGTYSVTETNIPAGWSLGSIDCTGQGSANATTNAESVDIILAAGDDITCTFTNNKIGNGTISITKVAQFGEAGDTFDFTGDIGAFTLADGETETATTLADGSYTIAEAVPDGWMQTDITCEVTDEGATAGVDSGSVYSAPEIAIRLVDDETVACTVTNQKQPTVTIIKDATPDDGTTFNFNINDSTTAATGSINGSGTVGTFVVQAGNVTVIEPPIADWTLQSTVCQDESGADIATTPGAAANSTDFVVASGDDITCTFTNVRNVTSSITIVKESVAGNGVDATFDFGGTLGDFVLTTTGGSTMSSGTASLTFDVVAGSYTVTENPNNLYDLIGLSCVDPTDNSTTSGSTATIDVADGEAITCTFTNQKKGRLIVSKETVGGDDSFDFSGDFATTLSGGGTDNTLITPGTYTVTEASVAGWALTNIDCSDGNSSGNIDTMAATYIISVGEQVDCTFTNTKLSTIVITKTVVPSGTVGSFDFTTNITPTTTPSFSLSGGQVLTITDLIDGNFAITETETVGWDLTEISCDSAATVDLDANSVGFDIAFGETIGCTFENTQILGTITIEKQTLPDGDTTAFAFTGDLTDSLADGESSTITVPMGTYSVVEGTVAGWTLTDISCTDPVGGNSSGDVDTSTATIDLAPGEDVTCVFTNTKDGSISIEKVTDPVNSATTFNFSGEITSILASGQSASAAVAPGTYSVIEAVAAGWALTDITCNDVDSSGNIAANEATFVVSPGENVLCVFTNTKLAVDISLDKELSNNADNDGSGSVSVGDILSYTFEVENTGSAILTNVTVTDDMVGAVNCPKSTLDPAESMTCTAAYIVQQTDVNAGQIVNNADVSGAGPEGDTATAEDTVITDIPQESSLDLVKSMAGYADNDGSGTITKDDVLTYEFVVTNNSNVTLSSVEVTDPLSGLSAIDCAPQTNGSVTLLPGEQLTCSATYIVTQDDVNSGSITNTATATASGPDGSVADQGSAQTDIAQAASIVLQKTMASSTDADGSGTVSAGDTLTYQFDISNSGSVTLNSVTVADPLQNLSAVNCAPLANGTITLAPSDTATCTATYVVTDEDAVAGQIDNTATATGNTQNGEDASDSSSVSTAVSGVTPSIEATKTDAVAVDADGDGVPSPGDTLRYTVTIISNGNFTAANVLFADTLDANTSLVVGTVTSSLGTVTLGNNADDASIAIAVGNMAVGQQVIITFDATINSSVDVNVLAVNNQGIISYDGQPDEPTDDPETPADNDPTGTAISSQPLISATKTDSHIDVDGDGIPSPGDSIEYAITIFNNGNQEGIAAFVNDPLDPNTTLTVGTITTSQGTVVTGNSSGDADIEIDLGSIAPGSTIEIVFRVSINNPLPAGVTTIANQGFVRGDNFPTKPTDDPDTAGQDSTRTSITATPSIDATKSWILKTDADNDDVPSPGDILTYNVSIINTGNTAATTIVFADNPDSNTTLIPGSVSTNQGAVATGNADGDSSVRVNVGTLANPGDSAEITFDVRIKSPLLASVGLIENQGIVTGDEFPAEPTDNPATSDNNDPTVTPLNSTPILSATKSDSLFIDADGNGTPSPGDTIFYEVIINNAGNGSASNITYMDTVDPNTTIIPGTVQTSQGVVTTGNLAGENTIAVLVGTLPGNNGQVSINYRVTINNPAATGVEQISNQGTIQADGVDSFRTDDPDIEGKSDPTATLITAIAQLSISKEDFLLLDNDKNISPQLEGPSSGDTLLYVIKIVNSGNVAATNALFTDAPDPNTTLIESTTQSTAGTVTTGNNSGDTTVSVSIPTIPAGESVTIGFSVVINEGTSVTTISNQGVLTADGISGASGLATTDPGTDASGDATITLLSTVPTALDSRAEPTDLQFSLFLPMVTGR